MRSLKSILTDPLTTKTMFTGIVRQSMGRGYYKVDVDGVLVSARSTITGLLQSGERMVLTKTGDEWFIVGGESIKNRSLVTVIVDG